MIELKNISFSYKKNNKVLEKINLKLNKGEIVAIIGKNGSGKSSLLKILANLVKYQGDAYLDNLNYRDYKEIKFRKEIGIVFQNPNNQIILPNVYQDMLFTLSNYKITNVDERINKSLKLLQMEDFKDKNPYELSLGEKQRINIANILSINPSFILLDEVTSMIDQNGKEIIYNLFKKLKNDGIGIVFGTNMLDEIIYADRIIILKDKKIYYDLKKDELLNNLDILEDIDIPLPFILKLIKKNKIPSNIIEIEKYLLECFNNE